jgi:hypothetical protein
MAAPNGWVSLALMIANLTSFHHWDGVTGNERIT